MMDKNKIMKYYQTDMWKEFLERMKKNTVKEYPNIIVCGRPHKTRSVSKEEHQRIRDFKGLMKSLLSDPSQMELQLTILEDVIMYFLTPYTRQLLIERINKRCEEREYLTKKENIEEIL